ncbi:hypothetical protein RCL1_004658 [Eukaryota sp. TZLM3-RCL]
MKKYVVFDLNETLVDTTVIVSCFSNQTLSPRENISRFWNKLFERLQTLAVTDDFLPFERVVKDVLTDLGESDALNCVLEKYPLSTVFDDVSETIAELKQHGISIVVATNSSTELIDRLKSVSPLTDVVDKWICFPCSKSLKPAPRSYKYLEEELHLEDRSQLVYISTHFWDIFAAQKAGLQTLHLGRNTSPASINGQTTIRVVTVPRMSMIVPICLSLFQDSTELAIKSKLS